MLTHSRGRGALNPLRLQVVGLDALEPLVYDELISNAIEKGMNPALYEEAIAEEEPDRGLIHLSAASVWAERANGHGKKE